MKTCPICDEEYQGKHTTCPRDGAFLLESRNWESGTVIRNKYRIVNKIGEGGMGVVYKAKHLVLEDYWALKVMSPDLARDVKAVQRFRQEARQAYRLDHPNIVRIRDFDQAEDASLFIAMEYIEGDSLRKVLQNSGGALPISRALEITEAVLRGLGEAHSLGIVHRDIKPENILIARDRAGEDLPKILDFGIAAIKEGTLGLSTRLQLTPPYSAPEQWLGVKSDKIDCRTDLYSCGLTLYEMLTGNHPFHSHSIEGWMRAHLEEVPPPPSSANPTVARLPELDVLVLDLIAKKPENRPSNTQQVIDRLRLIQENQPWAAGTKLGFPTPNSFRTDVPRVTSQRPVRETNTQETAGNAGLETARAKDHSQAKATVASVWGIGRTFDRKVLWAISLVAVVTVCVPSALLLRTRQRVAQYSSASPSAGPAQPTSQVEIAKSDSSALQPSTTSTPKSDAKNQPLSSPAPVASAKTTSSIRAADSKPLPELHGPVASGLASTPPVERSSSPVVAVSNGLPAVLTVDGGTRIWIVTALASDGTDKATNFQGSLLQPVRLSNSIVLDQGTRVRGSIKTEQPHPSIFISEFILKGVTYALSPLTGGTNANLAGTGEALTYQSGQVFEMWFGTTSLYQRKTLAGPMNN